MSDGTAEYEDKPALVVGIGASAGGLEAIERLVCQLPVDTGMAFVLVQHLSPDFKSLMNEVLSRWTDMPIYCVVNGMPVRRNAIYLMPRRSVMVLSEGRLLITEKDPTATLTLPIDHFFRSLAQDCGRRCAAVVLSGTGSDGSRGVIDVHEAGGLVIAQQPDSAKFDGMPRSAIATGAVDLTLKPEEAPAALARFAKQPLSPELAAAAQDPLGETSGPESGLNRVLTLVRKTYDLDLNHYKPNTVIRRIERRLMLAGVEHVDPYAERLANDPDELDQLYRDLLIGVTRFFRDGEAFELLARQGLPGLLATKGPGDDLRVWVAGCATGEEAYSLTMLLDELLCARGEPPRLKVFATDVHKESLETAGHGVYPVESLAGVSQERLATYFEPTAGGYQVKPRLRQPIVFAPHNLVKDAPFTKIDLIACRNLLIYLQPQSQKKVISLFHFGLKTGGVLMMGPSESPGDLSEEFEPIDAHWKLYRKRRDIRLPPDMRLHAATQGQLSRGTGLPVEAPATPMPGADRMVLSTYDALLDLLAPNGLLVAESGALVHTFGDAGRFLLPERGRFSGAVLDRLVGDLRVPASTAIGKALKEQKPASYAGVPVMLPGEEQVSVDLRAVPVNDKRMKTRSVLLELGATPAGPDDQRPDSLLDTGKISTEKISVLETELRYTKENLQATIEELETSNEELQATNEELVASNEELQSTNEELHSVNEELYTVNSEHQNKIQELSELTRDMDNLLASTEVHTVFLDSALAIRKFTPGGAEAFNFLPQDVGRRIDSFTHRLKCEGLTEKLHRVVHTGAAIEEEVEGRGGDWYLMRLLPYRTADASDGGRARPIDGALITLIEITKLREASTAVEESLRQRDRFLAMLSHELRNPLSTILNATHLLAAPEEDDASDEPVAVIRRQSRHMATLLDDLLDVTRVSQGKISLQKRPFDLMRAVRGALESVVARCEAREQQLDAELPDGPIWVRGSEPRLLQVFSNLLVNAMKYSAHGGRIELAVSVDSPPDGAAAGDAEAAPAPGWVVVTVRDNGVGISAEAIDRVFDMFVQANRTLDRADGGLGVGLTLVKSLVELHGGAVAAASDGEGCGAEFTVRLPTCPPPREAPRPAEPERDTEPGRRVVLVEDNIDASRMLAFLLEEAGFQVSIAHDGARGLELIGKSRPDAAVIDIGLPGMSGYDVARQIREDESLDGMRLIALTGYGQATDRSEAIGAGFNEHLVKPVDPELLSRMLCYKREPEGRDRG